LLEIHDVQSKEIYSSYFATGVVILSCDRKKTTVYSYSLSVMNRRTILSRDGITAVVIFHGSYFVTQTESIAANTALCIASYADAL